MMQELAKLQFQSFAIKLPTNWQQPMGGAGKMLVQALSPDNLVGNPVPLPPLFVPATNNKLHCDTAQTLSTNFGTYMDGICSAICSAWSQWQQAATLVGTMINAVVASGGQVVGPALTPLILASAPMATPNEMKYSNAIATAIGTGWLAYTSSIKVPGLPWYPAFAAFPAPMAPPMPNIPTPVIALTQVTTSVSKSTLKPQMLGLLADPTAPHSQELMDSVADAFEKCFTLWQSTTMVTNVLGMGPVPTFAPPVVPVGPVVGGVGNMLPGGFV
jgi:hypothetical protein